MFLLVLIAISLLAVTVFVFQDQDLGFLGEEKISPIVSSTPIQDEELVEYLKQYDAISLDSLPPIDATSIAEVSAVLDQSSKAIVSNQSYPYSTFLPALLRTYPLPEGYKFNIFQYMDSINVDRLTATTANLVNNYSPRSHVANQVFDDYETCKKNPEKFEKSNLIRALEDLQTQFESLGYKVIQEPVPGMGGSYNLVIDKTPSDIVTYPGVIEISSFLDNPATSPGASQSALSAAGVLELAVVLQKYPNRHPWRFVILIRGNEDLSGSKEHIKQIIGQPFKIALILEGIGWSETEPEYMNCTIDTNDLPYTMQVGNLFDWVRKLYGIGINWRRCSAEEYSSSFTQYWEVGLPAIMSIGGMPYSDPEQNKCTDNMNNLDVFNGYLTLQQNLGVLLTIDQVP